MMRTIIENNEMNHDDSGSYFKFVVSIGFLTKLDFIQKLTFYSGSKKENRQNGADTCSSVKTKSEGKCEHCGYCQHWRHPWIDWSLLKNRRNSQGWGHRHNRLTLNSLTAQQSHTFRKLITHKKYNSLCSINLKYITYTALINCKKI